MAAEDMHAVSACLKQMRFRKRLFGGVDEEDVWRKLEKLQAEYQSAYDAQRIRCEALLGERDKEIAELRAAVRQLRILSDEGGGP